MREHYSLQCESYKLLPGFPMAGSHLQRWRGAPGAGARDCFQGIFSFHGGVRDRPRIRASVPPAPTARHAARAAECESLREHAPSRTPSVSIHRVGKKRTPTIMKSVAVVSLRRILSDQREVLIMAQRRQHSLVGLPRGSCWSLAACVGSILRGVFYKLTTGCAK